MKNDEMTRRGFVGAAAAGLAAAATATTVGAQQQVVEKDVEIKTPDGTCDAAFIYPASGAHAAVIVWPDAFGLRQSMRDMGKVMKAAQTALAGANADGKLVSELVKAKLGTA